jgi:hypothetical protein
MTTTITRHEDGTISQVGGVTRVTHGQQELADPASLAGAPKSTTRVGNKITRFDGTTGAAVTSNGIARYQQGSDRTPAQSVAQSIRTEGSSKTVELVPGDPASRTLLSVALREGLIVETAPGIYADRNAPQGAQQDPSGAQADAPKDDPLADTVYNAGELATWQGEIADIPQHSYDGAVAGVTAALATANPDKLEGVISALSQTAGMEPEQAREYVETGIEWYANSISKDLQKSMGMSAAQVDALYDTFRDRGHPRLAEAIQQVAITGRSEVFRELALDFKRKSAADTDMSAFTKAGWQHRVDRDTGDIVVRRGEGSWATLAQVAKGRA